MLPTPLTKNKGPSRKKEKWSIRGTKSGRIKKGFIWTENEESPTLKTKFSNLNNK